MSTTKTTNTVSEIINTVENAQKLAKEQENPSYIAMFKPWVLDVSEFQVNELTAYNMNTGSRLNSQVAKMFTFVQMYAKRSNELVKKEREIAAVMKKYNLPREIAERMYVDGVLKA